MFWSFTKVLLKGGSSLARKFLQRYYCHACHARFAVFFPLLSYCVKFINDQKWCIPFSWRQNACQLLIRLDATSEHALRCSIWDQRQIIISNVITIVSNLHHLPRIRCIDRAAFSVSEFPKIHSVCTPPPNFAQTIVSKCFCHLNVALTAIKRIPQKQYLTGA